MTLQTDHAASESKDMHGVKTWQGSKSIWRYLVPIGIREDIANTMLHALACDVLSTFEPNSFRNQLNFYLGRISFAFFSP